jgi:hypothetical protein
MNWFKGTKSQGIFFISKNVFYHFFCCVDSTIYYEENDYIFLENRTSAKLLVCFLTRNRNSSSLELKKYTSSKTSFQPNPKLLKFIQNNRSPIWHVRQISFFSKVLLPILLWNLNITKLCYEISCTYVFSIKWK